MFTGYKFSRIAEGQVGARTSRRRPWSASARFFS